MNGNWAEREESLIKLPEDDPKIFATYINHVYTSTIATRATDEPRLGTIICDELVCLCKLYVLGEKLCDPAAKNATIEAILTASTEKDGKGQWYYPLRSSIKIIYDGTPAGSPGRRLMADLWTNFSIKTDYFAESAQSLPKEFWFDLALALRKDRPAGKKSVAEANDVSEYLEKVV